MIEQEYNDIIVPEQFHVLWAYDEDGIQLIDQYDDLGWDGGRGGTKSWSLADFLLDEGRQETKRILCGREVYLTIKDSSHKLLSDKIKERGYTDYHVTQTSIKNKITGSEFTFVGFKNNHGNVMGFEGYDYCWIDQAECLSLQSLTELIPTIRKAGSKIFYTFNRDADNDPVWEKVFRIPDDRTFHCKINIFDVEERFQSKKLLRQAAKDKIRDKEEWLHIWMGEPRGQQPNAILSRYEVMEAMQRKIDVSDLTPESVGADIAREGDDRITFFKRKGNKFTAHKIYTKLKTYDTESRLKDFIGNKETHCNIDMGNMGSGIYDHLKLAGYNVHGINFGGKKALKNPELYANIATEMWFEFANDIGKMELPYNEELKNELTSRQFSYKNVNIKKGKKVFECEVKIVEPKDIYKKREGNSPDLADGAILGKYVPGKQRKAIPRWM